MYGKSFMRGGSDVKKTARWQARQRRRCRGNSVSVSHRGRSGRQEAKQDTGGGGLACKTDVCMRGIEQCTAMSDDAM